MTKVSPGNASENGHTPDFWVLFQIRHNGGNEFNERFFVLTHQEIRDAQQKRNDIYAAEYRARHNREFDFATGVDSVKITDVEHYEDHWDKII